MEVPRLGKRPLLVVVTGYGQASDHEPTRVAGFDAHVVKPVDFGHLADLLDRLFARARATWSRHARCVPFLAVSRLTAPQVQR